MKNKRITIILGIVFLVVAGGTILYFNLHNKSAQTSKGENKTYIEGLKSSSSNSEKSSSTSSQSSNSSSSSSSSSTETEISKEEKENISTFITTYVTYDLTVDSVMERNTNLSKVMTTDGFKSANIQSTTDTMVALVNKWQTTREVDTSNGDVQLVSQKYQSAKVTNDKATKGRYYVELHYTQTPATTDKPEKMVEMLWLTTKDNKINSVQIISTRTDS